VSAPEASAEASPRTQAASRPDPRPPADIAAESPPLPSTAALDTDFGGVFFLVNALLALGLYPDFTRPLGGSLGPSPFWLLDRLALRMFGGPYRRDPLHRWLAAIGVERPLPPRWEVEPRWLAGLPSATHGFRRSRTRTILWDLRGFALLDGPRGLCRARRAVARRYRRCGPLANRLPALPRRTMPRDPGGRWIACLAEFLCARLALAGEGLGPQALRLAARVVVDEERVDLRFDLARLPIELRLAGLDRDPGWLPAEGRSLSFHFE
jgi:hypothetical protein